MTAFRERAAADMTEYRPGETVTPIMRKLVTDAAALVERGSPDASRRATEARAYAVANLDGLHAELARNLGRRGIGYHRASDATEAVSIVRALLGDAKRVAKSKSMVAEEIGLTPALRAAGMDVLETDIGEYLVDIEGRGPSHITAPALHLNRRRIQEMLNRTGAALPDDDPGRLSRYVRDVVSEFFSDCDAGITGVNMAIASSGRLVLIENEGNVALGASHPRLHIAVTGLEKVVADERAALSVLEVLASNATAQPLTAFTHILGGPAPGQQRHVVFVDNGRSRIASDERYRDVLKCIRCGACMNGCPVYRVAGGLSYGSPYMGPIGAVVSPLLWPGEHSDLPFASSLCGSCTEACPVGIPLHRMLLELRSDAVNAGQAGGARERGSWRVWSAVAQRRGLARAIYGAAGRLARLVGPRLQPSGTDPRVLSPTVERDPGMLLPLVDRRPAGIPPPAPRPGAPGIQELLRERLVDAAVTVAGRYETRPGDRLLSAAAAIASTGSVVLTGEGADRGALLSARRVVVRVDPASTVRYPVDAAESLGDGDALILTGASRTADIEKQIVRGIHGAEELVVVLDGGGSED